MKPLKLSKRLCTLLAVALIAGLFASCASPGAAPSPASPAQPPAPAAPDQNQTPDRLDTLTVAITYDENTITPVTYVRGTPGLDVMRFIYDSLFTISPDNVAVPWMVEDDYAVGADMQTFAVTLRDGLYWHDGTPVTADDVAFTFDYFKNVFTAYTRWTNIARQVESIDVNGRELVFNLENPNPGFIRVVLADMPIVSKAQYEGVEDPTELPSLGSGAYRLAEYRVGEFYTLEAMDDYFRGTPSVKIIRMPIMDVSAAQQAMLAGQLAGYTGGVSVELIDIFSGSPDIELVSSDGYASTLLLMSNVRPPFDDADFRRAISLALDLDQLVDIITLGNATKGTAGYVRDGLDEHVTGLDYTYDQNAANTLLDSLGYANKDADGMRLGLDGSPMELEILTSGTRARDAELISMQLESVGLRIRVTTLDPDALDMRVWPDFDTSQPHDYQMAMFGWSAPVVQRNGAIIGVCSSDYAGVGGLNLSHYDSKEFDAAAEAFLASVDPAERAMLNEQMQRTAAGDFPFVTLYFADNINAVNTQQYSGWVFPKGGLAVNVFSFLP
ncbi:MAG: ABC transporter substrate-binding protein [Clostridiales bacterium]|nr:ABC transporter substrate-binding protein [Clostridiales bacterium]